MDPQQMQQLQTRLEDLRRRQQAGRLHVDEVQSVLEDARVLRGRAQGTAMEGTLEVILDLLQTISRNTGVRDQLRAHRRTLAQAN